MNQDFGEKIRRAVDASSSNAVWSMSRRANHEKRT